MENSGVLKAVTFLGIALTVLSFVLYVAAPDTIFIAMFVIGMVLLAAGYIMSARENKIVTRALEERKAELERIGYIISLDGIYIPENNDATIEYLG